MSRRWLWVSVPLVAAAAVVFAVFGGSVVPECGTSVADVGCGAPSLAPAPGVSVVTGQGRLTGVTRTRFGTPLHEIEIQHVKVLAGPARPATLHAWLATVPQPGPGLAAAQVPGLWAPDGQLLAYVGKDPSVAVETSTVLVRPIVQGDVVFSAAACGSAPEGLRTTSFKGPLAEVPDSRSYTVAQCNGGFSAVPLSQVRRALG